MADLARAERRIDKILMRWFNDDTTMLGVWCMVEKIPSKSQETMGIDSRYRPPKVRYNPNFVNEISMEQLEMVMASEGFKLLLRHTTTRLKNPKELSNIASSIEVNDVMNYFPGLDYVLSPKSFGLETGQYYEWYFRKLKENSDEVKQKVAELWNSMSDEEKQQSVQNAKDQIDQEQQGQDDNKDGDGYPQMGDGSGKDPLKEYHDPEGTSNQDWSDNAEVDAAVKNFIQNNKDGMGYGKHTGKASGHIIAAGKPKISWREIIRRFHTSVVTGTTVSTRKKVNRRYDLTYPGTRRTYQAKLIFAIDVSGSMSDEDIAEGFAVINAICKHSKIDYLLFDTEVKLVEKNYKIARSELNICGRGGTNFTKVIEYANEHKSDGLIIFSDMMAPPPPKPRGTKVLWLSHTKGQKPPVDWGMQAELNRYE